VPINRLKILDVLIEQLAQMKKRPEPALDAEPSDEQIDALIDQYQGQLRAAQAAVEAAPYKNVPAAPAGTVVNLVA
jgi:hypothetical protein